ncbi:MULTISPECIES: hypothetical protein [Euryhalocaulis]|nr:MULTISPECIES: hypothetical protein [Euryhalocaulis]MBA4801717.1 hypothetical protein [Euryhalocaulis sp.]
MKKYIAALAALGMLGVAACEDEAEIETPAGEVEVEEDGDVNVNEN